MQAMAIYFRKQVRTDRAVSDASAGRSRRDGRDDLASHAAYCSAKAGVDMIKRCAALKLGPKRIRVIGLGLGLGLVDTPKHNSAAGGPTPDVAGAFSGLVFGSGIRRNGVLDTG
jgi:NAD(P)-dependent dehydrogenase (short-subunit alcohol dehydrogenase family)